MLQLSSVLEMQAHRLRRDALAYGQCYATSGTATTGFWSLLEGFFGVDEDPGLASLEDATSLAETLRLRRLEKEKDSKVASLSVPKESISVDPEEPEAEEILDSESTTSSQLVEGAHPKTLSQIKKHHDKVDQYPNKCSIGEAQLFFPSSEKTVHQTGVPSKYIGDREDVGPYKGAYCCLYGEGCEYGAQSRGVVCTHVCRVHLGVALACRYCPNKVWWQARYWLLHMKDTHPDLPFYEPISMASTEPAASSEIAITEEHFKVPAPSKKAKLDDPPSVKTEPSEVVANWSAISRKSYDVYVPADPPPERWMQPCPRAAAIRYPKTSKKAQEASVNVPYSSVPKEEDSQKD